MHAAPASIQHEPPAASPRPIACMEVWGGSAAFDGAVSVPGNDVRISCVPHEGGRAGGDVYYVSNCAAGLITRFFLADVAGHGEQVAAIARSLRTLMRRHINTADQTRFAVELNRAFAALDLNGRFATAVLMTYFAPTDHLIVCNAGHPRPLFFRAAARRWALLHAGLDGVLATRRAGEGEVGIANLPLGILDPTDYEQFAVHLAPGDVVVAYTDALVEAPDAAGRQLGEAGLLHLASQLSPDGSGNLGALVPQRLVERSGGRPLDDDATLVVLRHTAEDPPRPTLAGRAAKLARMLGLGAIDSEPSAIA